MTDLMTLAEQCEKADGPDRELDLAIHLALWPDGDIAKVTKFRRGLDSQDGLAWTIHQQAVIFEKWADGRCPYNGGYRLLEFTGSIDAAASLADGGAFTVGQNVHHHHWVASVNALSEGGASYSLGSSNACRSGALALCSAALRAKDSRHPVGGSGKP